MKACATAGQHWQAGDKSCDYGCLGYGTCAAVCPFGAITMNDNDIPVIDITKCRLQEVRDSMSQEGNRSVAGI